MFLLMVTRQNSAKDIRLSGMPKPMSYSPKGKAKRAETGAVWRKADSAGYALWRTIYSTSMVYRHCY